MVCKAPIGSVDSISFFSSIAFFTALPMPGPRLCATAFPAATGSFGSPPAIFTRERIGAVITFRILFTLSGGSRFTLGGEKLPSSLPAEFFTSAAAFSMSGWYLENSALPAVIMDSGISSSASSPKASARNCLAGSTFGLGTSKLLGERKVNGSGRMPSRKEKNDVVLAKFLLEPARADSRLPGAPDAGPRARVRTMLSP
mmetsp:Transcript_13910/g.34359  ORF Transcript_13910/g.34359 Transcript_13910/m.34359 type:complete len:200 (+) Transcript_13910:1113-1712(+)